MTRVWARLPRAGDENKRYGEKCFWTVNNKMEKLLPGFRDNGRNRVNTGQFRETPNRYTELPALMGQLSAGVVRLGKTKIVISPSSVSNYRMEMPLDRIRRNRRRAIVKSVD